MCNRILNIWKKISLVYLSTYETLKFKPDLVSDSSHSYGIDSTQPLKSKGKFKASIFSNNQNHETEIYVFEGVCDNLLSFNSSICLGLLHLTYSTMWNV